MMPVVLLFVQILLLALIWKGSTVGATRLVYKMANPYCWVVGIYTLWFLVPQVSGLFFDFYIIGLDQYSVSELRGVFVDGQLWLCVFLLSILLPVYGMFFVYSRNSGESSVRSMLSLSFSAGHTFYLYLFFMIGLLASFYIASLNVGNVGGFRSDIVKTLIGKIATAASYLGAFSFAYLSMRFLGKRRWFPFLILLVLFVAGVMLTGARGRLLWPIAILLIFVAARQDRLNILKLVVFGVCGFLLLLTLDPIVKIVKEGMQSYSFSLEEFFAPIIYKRNFDGFANFSLIVSQDVIRQDLSYLLTGGRDPFMDTFYQRIYQLGVGFGSTIPGLFWMSGGAVALVIGGFLYSLMLGLLNAWLRVNKSNLLFWSYLFAMPWLCAVGGNIIESLDKMLVAAFGPVFLSFLHSRQERRRSRKTSRR